MNYKALKKYFKDKDIEFALIFGSFANGKTHTFSDVDIGIYFKKEPDILEIGDIINELEDILQKKVDLIILNKLYKTDPYLAYNITNNHKLIICKNQDKYIDFKAFSYIYYFDFQPVRKMLIESFLKRYENGR